MINHYETITVMSQRRGKVLIEIVIDSRALNMPADRALRRRNGALPQAQSAILSH